MKKVVLGLAVLAFIVAGSVNVSAQDKTKKEKAKTEVKAEKKSKKSCCSKKTKACDSKDKKAKKDKKKG